MSTPPYVPGHGLLRDRNVVITAAAGSGIGFAAARRCAEEGASVLISDIHPRRLAAAAEKISEITGKPCSSVLCDVTVEADIQNLFKTATDVFGHVDVLINNAGLGGETPLVEMTDSQWDRVIDISLTGTMRCMRAALRHMMPRNSGVIINNASVLGWRAQAGQSHYAAAKAGVMALTRCAAIEAAPANVRINAVAPSLAMHPFLHKVTSP